MTNVPAKLQPNPFSIYGDSVGPANHIVGELLKFSKGDWLAGQEADELPQYTKLVALMTTLTVGWQKWEYQKPVAYRMGLLVDGFIPPRRDELGDTDDATWEVDDEGRPKDPWQLTNYLQLCDPTDATKIYTFTTASKGGLGAVGKLCKEYGRESEKRADQWPMVTLGSGSYAHKDRSLGRIKFPEMLIVGWVRQDDLSPVKDDIGDAVPY